MDKVGITQNTHFNIRNQFNEKKKSGKLLKIYHIHDSEKRADVKKDNILKYSNQLSVSSAYTKQSQKQKILKRIL